MRKVYCKNGTCSLDRPPTQLGLGEKRFKRMGKNGTSGLLVEGLDYLLPLSNIQKPSMKKGRVINQRGRGRKLRSSTLTPDSSISVPVKKKSCKRKPLKAGKSKTKKTSKKKAAKPKKLKPVRPKSAKKRKPKKK